ncbi:MAG: PD-(D/E)XK nuclease family protein [Ruminococcus flavefaciens]|nr:PD-(D/E)XK nuclease family protein [Ruminococcus flavefaciens]
MAQSDYEATPKRYSATTLLKPIRAILLGRRHDSEIDEDCSEKVWALFGQAVHYIMEHNADGASEFAEEKLTVTLDNGYTISGKIDLYDIDKALVVDWKTASVWKWIYQDFEDWRLQGLTYAWLLRKNGLPCDKVQFVAILKDHSKTEAKRKAKDGYPRLPVQTYSFAVTDDDIAEIDKILRDKIDELIKYEPLPDNELPLCSAEDRWNTGDKYAVMKKGRKTALRVLDSLHAAQQYMAANGGDYIEERKGIDRRCEEYCSCCKFCDYWKEHYGEQADDKVNTED